MFLEHEVHPKFTVDPQSLLLMTMHTLARMVMVVTNTARKIGLSCTNSQRHG